MSSWVGVVVLLAIIACAHCSFDGKWFTEFGVVDVTTRHDAFTVECLEKESQSVCWTNTNGHITKGAIHFSGREGKLIDNYLLWDDGNKWTRFDTEENIMFKVNEHQLVKKCRHGVFLINVHDNMVSKSLNVYGEWSEKELVIFKEIINEGDVVIDIGANVGAFTVPFSKMVGPKGLVYAFEPQFHIFQTLCANVALNLRMNVMTFPFALGDEMGTSNIPRVNYKVDANFGALSLGKDYQVKGQLAPLVVPKVTLDSMFEKRDCPKFIKIDVEGWETKVLSGALQTLQRCRPLLFVENNQLKQSRSLIELISKAGYTIFWVYQPYFNENNFFGVRNNPFPFDLYAINILCIPNEVRSNYHLNGFVQVYPEQGRFYFHEYSEELEALGFRGTMNGQE
mmetsp:Transcript_3426/g.4945  ORF Transcript_3426/g.4945 Transcript_3426/m.4945 type:complete len:396 (-) Transcript_3426:36-1223(-)